jgi:ATP-dependent RNA helicase DeaD
LSHLEYVNMNDEIRPDSLPQGVEDPFYSPPGVEKHLVEPEDRLPQVSLDDLPPRLKQATQRAGWSQLTPVQSKAMPYIMAGRDLMVQSHTGSGKTGAFIMPIIELVNAHRDACQALVLVPTRELARQVAKDAELLAGSEGMRTIAVYGGVKYGPQLAA